MQAYWLLREIQRCAPLIQELGEGKFIYAGPTLTLLEQQAIPAFQALFCDELELGRLIMGRKPKFEFSKEGLQKVLGFTNCPVTVRFAYTNDSSNLESMTALAGVWDEAGQKENKLASLYAYNRRLKVAQSKGYGRRLWGTTPYEWNWFKTEVHDLAEKGQEGFGLFNFPSWMNPRVSEAECRKELDKGMPLWQWQMMYLGQFTRPAGAIYDCFDNQKHVCDRFEIPAQWPRFIGIDFGQVGGHTAAIYLAQDPARGIYYAYRVYCPKEPKPVEQHVMAMRKGEPLNLRVFGGSHQEDGWREAFSAKGLHVLEPRVSEVEKGIECVYGAFKRDQLIVFRDLQNLIAEILSYSRELDDSGEPTDKIQDKSKYHRLDGLRYVGSSIWTGPGMGMAKVYSRFNK